MYRAIKIMKKGAQMAFVSPLGRRSLHEVNSSFVPRLDVYVVLSYHPVTADVLTEGKYM